MNPDSGAPESFFGHGATGTVMHPFVAVAMILAIILMLVLPRRHAVVPFLLGVFLLPIGQQLYLGGVHFYVPRILILFGLVRIALTKLLSQDDIVSGGWNSVDVVFFLWAILRGSAGILRGDGNTASLLYEGGFLLDALGGYFLLRFLIQNEESILRVVKTFAAIAAVLAVTMLNEKLLDQNIFGYLGSLPVRSDIRVGAIRAQGPFEHSILAGVFAATLLPFFLWLWQSRKARIAGVVGAIGCTIMVVTTASATPLLTYLAVLLGLCFWLLRKHMRMVRWGIVAMIIALAMVMKAPVWFLISHVDVVAGNSGYHRAMLIDTCIRHFSDWWLIGTNQTLNWGFDMWDTSNQFVAEAEAGGLAAFICFVLMISWCFRRIGRARKLVEGDHKQEWFFWLLGVALFAHIVAFFGISYFDQTKYAWYALFAIIVVATAPILARESAVEEHGAVELSGTGQGLTPLTAPQSSRIRATNLRSRELTR